MKKKPKVSYIVLIVIGILTVIFTVACMWFFFLFQTIPDTLVQMFYTTVVGELLVVGLIRIMKTKYEKDEDDEDEFRSDDEDN